MTGAPLLGRIPIETAVSEGGDAGTPVVIDDQPGAAASSLRAIADLIATEMLPPVEMKGCTARMLVAVAR
jgi:ATP-binding protein involved in chromosome partitioning